MVIQKQVNSFFQVSHVITTGMHQRHLSQIRAHITFIAKCFSHCLHVSSSVGLFLQNHVFRKQIFQKHYQSVKQLGSRSGPTFCRA